MHRPEVGDVAWDSTKPPRPVVITSHSGGGYCQINVISETGGFLFKEPRIECVCNLTAMSAAKEKKYKRLMEGYMQEESSASEEVEVYERPYIYRVYKVTFNVDENRHTVGQWRRAKMACDPAIFKWPQFVANSDAHFRQQLKTWISNLVGLEIPSSDFIIVAQSKAWNKHLECFDDYFDNDSFEIDLGE